MDKTRILVSVAQLVTIRGNLYMGPTSPHIICVNLATRLLGRKKKSYIKDYYPLAIFG